MIEKQLENRSKERRNEKKLRERLCGSISSFALCKSLFSCPRISTICPGSSDPIYIVSYYIKWVTTSWTYSSISGQPVIQNSIKYNSDTN